MTEQSIEAYRLVYQALDQVCFHGVASAGATGALYSAIDGLRASAAPIEHVALAERIAVTLHKLGWAVLQKRDNEIEALREELQVLGAEWLNTPIPLVKH
jgi:hypothetical protein